jgi:hypothetical protein
MSVSFCIFSFNECYLFRLLIPVTRLIQYDCCKVQIFFLLAENSLGDRSVWLQVTNLKNSAEIVGILLF